LLTILGPGDDKVHKCPEGTIAPQRAMANCTSCPSKRSESRRVFCILEDTPAESREAKEDVFAADNHNPYWYNIVYFTGFSGTIGRVAEYTFVDEKNPNTHLAVYASTKTGKPSKANYEFYGIGPNVTLLINSDDQAGKLVYFYVVPVEVQAATVKAMTFPYLAVTYPYIAPNVPVEFRMGTVLARMPYNGVNLVTSVVPKSKINVTVTLEGQRFHEDVQFTLFYTGAKSIHFPNEYNAQIVVKSTKATVASASFTVVDVEGGSLPVMLFTTTVWDGFITASFNTTS
jgi:hypothetical protein